MIDIRLRATNYLINIQLYILCTVNYPIIWKIYILYTFNYPIIWKIYILSTFKYLKNIHLIYIQLSNYLINIHYSSHFGNSQGSSTALMISLDTSNELQKRNKCSFMPVEMSTSFNVCGNVNQFQYVCGNICQSVQRYFYPNASSSISAIVTPCQSKSVWSR